MHAVPTLLRGGGGGSLASSMQDLSSDHECFIPKEKKLRGKKSAQSKENLVDLLKEYRLEQKLKDEELEKKPRGNALKENEPL